jgi:phosphatidylserine/phosphatidylglycerophosphate/cardiolipin synthase-like enzyme
MSTGNINLDILLGQIYTDKIAGTDASIKHIMNRYPALSWKQAEEIYRMVSTACESNLKIEASLVATIPPSFTIKAKSTKNTVENLICGAERNILITGYSLSGYFSNLIDMLIEKSQKGIYVKFFVNNIEKQKNFDKLCRYKGRFLHIYNFSNESDTMAALHAKVISVDQEKTLITSANLSYHGQEGNIELGTLVKSEKIARQVDDILTHLIFTKVVKEI